MKTPIENPPKKKIKKRTEKEDMKLISLRIRKFGGKYRKMIGLTEKNTPTLSIKNERSY